MVVLVRGDDEVRSWPLPARHPDLALVDELARLQLEACRRGCAIRLRSPGPRLWELLQLAGMARVVPGGGELVVEMGGEPEHGEQPGVEEGMEGGDPVT